MDPQTEDSKPAAEDPVGAADGPHAARAMVVAIRLATNRRRLSTRPIIRWSEKTNVMLNLLPSHKSEVHMSD